MHTPIAETGLPRRYRVVAPIGIGSTSLVFHAVDRLSGREVAIKQLRPPLDNDRDREQQWSLAREFRILSSLRHPHVVSVFDYGFDQAQQPFLVMEHLASRATILHAIGNLSLQERLALVIDLFTALAYLHRNGVIHHDLTPDHLLVEDGRLCLIDFGMALRNDERSDDRYLGTPRYLAPELFEGQPYDEAADRFSAGVISWEVLSGHYPFATTLQSDSLAHVSAADLPLGQLAEWPAVAAVLRPLLVAQPEARPTAEMIASQLAALCEQPADAPRFDPSRVRVGRVVGREREQAELRAALQRIAEGESEIWLIGGESGFGKSRLADELRIDALVADYLVLYGQALEGGGSPYNIWADPIRRLLLEADLTTVPLGVLVDVIPDLARLIGHAVLPAPPIGDPSLYRNRLAAVIVQLLNAQPRPTLLVFEDFHWADESLELLREVFALSQHLRLLVVATHRFDGPTDPANRLTDVHQLRLAELSHTAAHELLSEILGDLAVPAQQIERLVTESEGNPFVLFEAATLLRNRFAQRQQAIDEVVMVADLRADNLQAMLQERLHSLPAADLALLQSVAIAGRRIEWRIVPLLNGPSLHAIGTLQERWHSAGIIEPQANDWRFSHDQIRAALITMIPPAERPTRYRRVAETLEATIPPPEAMLWYEALVELWRVADDRRRELRYLLLALRHVYSIAASYDRAWLMLARARNLVAELDRAYPRLTTYLLRLSGDIDFLRRHYPEAIAAYREALKSAVRVGLIKERYAILSGLTTALWHHGAFDEAVTYAREVLADGLLPRYLKWQVWPVIIQALSDQWKARQGDAEVLLDALIILAQEHNQSYVLARVLNSRGRIALSQSLHREAAHYFHASLQFVRNLGARQGEAMLFSNLAECAVLAADWALAEAHCHEAEQIFAQIGDSRGPAMITAVRSDMAWRRGADQLALEYAEQALYMAEEIADGYHVAVCERMIGALLLRLGHTERAQAALEQSLEQFSAIGFLPGRATALAGLARLNAEADRNALSLEQLNAAIGLCRQANLGVELIAALWLQAGLARGQGEFLRAKQALDEALALAHVRDLPFERTITYLNLLRLATASGEFQGGLAYLHQATLLCQQIESDPLKIQTLLAAAEWQIAKGNQRLAAEWLGLVLSHPVTDAPRRNFAEQLRARAARDLSPLDLVRRLAEGGRRDLRAEITAIHEETTNEAQLLSSRFW